MTNERRILLVKAQVVYDISASNFIQEFTENKEPVREVDSLYEEGSAFIV